YTDNSTGGITTNNPVKTYETINGVQRWHLRWSFSPNISIASGQTLYLTFRSTGTQGASGSYYNEMVVVPDNPLPKIFSDLGISYTDFNSSYTWNSAPVIVPAYDSSATAGSTTTTTTDANLGLTTGSIAILSYQVR
ncbi:MAG: hypothetical protein HYU83_07075, partial [Chloroflexi bacterium]|nr:hypothetical protein [Chloroflexota bacterium]